jgi:hypothetical protein
MTIVLKLPRTKPRREPGPGPRPDSQLQAGTSKLESPLVFCDMVRARRRLRPLAAFTVASVKHAYKSALEYEMMHREEK